MIGGLFTGMAASPLMRAALRYDTIALAVLLFLLALRLSGERAERFAADSRRRYVLEPKRTIERRKDVLIQRDKTSQPNCQRFRWSGRPLSAWHTEEIPAFQLRNLKRIVGEGEEARVGAGRTRHEVCGIV